MKKIISTWLISLLAVSIGFGQSQIQKETLVYATKDGKELKLDKYIDNSQKTTTKRPVMIYVHGGGFSMGSSKNALQIKYNKHFAAQGFVSISINYRLGIPVGLPFDRDKLNKAAILSTEDLIDATAYIISKAKEWNIDTKKIIISGGSAGAITSLNAEYAICSESTISKRLPQGFNYAGLISHAGNIITEQDTLIWKNKPCPMLLMHGTIDDLLPINSIKQSGTLHAGSNYIHKQLSQMNVSHWFYEEVGADHIVALKPLQHNFGEVDTFIDRFVMKKVQSIVYTHWQDKTLGSMAKMKDIVPLYMTGWEKTDDEVEQK